MYSIFFSIVGRGQRGREGDIVCSIFLGGRQRGRWSHSTPELKHSGSWATGLTSELLSTEQKVFWGWGDEQKGSLKVNIAKRKSLSGLFRTLEFIEQQCCIVGRYSWRKMGTFLPFAKNILAFWTKEGEGSTVEWYDHSNGFFDHSPLRHILFGWFSDGVSSGIWANFFQILFIPLVRRLYS